MEHSSDSEGEVVVEEEEEEEGATGGEVGEGGGGGDNVGASSEEEDMERQRSMAVAEKDKVANINSANSALSTTTCVVVNVHHSMLCCLVGECTVQERRI